jgi:hypothetical protein
MHCVDTRHKLTPSSLRVMVSYIASPTELTKTVSEWKIQVRVVIQRDNLNTLTMILWQTEYVK